MKGKTISKKGILFLAIFMLALFSGCVDSTPVQITDTSRTPTATPAPTLTPTPASKATSIPVPISTPVPALVPEVTYDKIGDIMGDKAAYNNKIINVKGQITAIHIPTGNIIYAVTSIISGVGAGIYLGESADLYSIRVTDDTGSMNTWVLKPVVDQKGIESGDIIELEGTFYYIQEKYSCQACGGDGVLGKDITCPICNGTGKCPVCGGDGKIDCAICGGTGKVLGVTCAACGGRGWVGCGACGGWFETPGSGVCSVCGGDGIIVEESTCPLCGGTGLVNLEDPSIPQEYQADYFIMVKTIQKV